MRWHSLVAKLAVRAMAIFMTVVPCCSAVHAAECDGLQIPDTIQVNETTLYLNGFGFRAISFLGLHIYVAALYLQRFSANSSEIIRSLDTKLLTITFEHDVSADAARSAWRRNLENSCTAPCRLEPEDVEKFIAGVPAMHAGDHFNLLFRLNILTVTLNGQSIGTISKRPFSEAILAAFLGLGTEFPRLRQQLLGDH